MRKPSYETKASNYLLRSKHSDSLIMVAAAVRHGRIGFDGGGSAILLNAAGQWTGNAGWAYGQLHKYGFIVSRRVPGTWRESKPELTSKGLLSLDGALATLRDVTAHTVNGHPITEAYFIAKIDSCRDTDGIGSIHSEPRWCDDHGWYAKHTPCAECNAEIAQYSDINDAPTIEPAPAAEVDARDANGRPIHVDDLIKHVNSGPGSKQSLDTWRVTAIRDNGRGIPIVSLSIPGDSDRRTSWPAHCSIVLASEIVTPGPVVQAPPMSDGSAELAYRRETLATTIAAAMLTPAPDRTEPPADSELAESNDVLFAGYQAILDARGALALGNITGRAASYLDEAAWWSSMAERHAGTDLGKVYRLAARGAELNARDLNERYPATARQVVRLPLRPCCVCGTGTCAPGEPLCATCQR
jgi:hypothetical protein